MNSMALFLIKVQPFVRLPVSEVERLSLLAQVIRYAKGDVIYSEGEISDSVWVLQSGRAITFQYNSDGRPLALDTVQPGEFMSPIDAIVGGHSPYPYTAVACMESTSIRIPNRYIQSLCARNPAMVHGIYHLCSAQLVRMRSRMVTSQEPVQQRIVRTLFQLQQSGETTLRYTKREISELAATTVETTIRVLSDLEKKHWVQSERGSITLTNIPSLQSLLGNSSKLPGTPMIRALAAA